MARSLFAALLVLLAVPLPRARPADAPEPPIEARGIWVTRWDFQSAADVRAVMEHVAAAGFNQVYFQVRGTADAYYRSTLEPWAAALSGTLGDDPGWDPLAVAIAEAHRLGLELHAWINLATAWQGALPPGRTTPAHLLRAHPDWRVTDRRGVPFTEGYVFFCPAHPDFQRHLEQVVTEIAERYPVDGLHLDYARYPARDTSFDRTSNRRFREARAIEPNLTRPAWQRRELTEFVTRLRFRLHAARPGIIVSAAVTGIYQDRWGWGGCSQGYEDFYQDSHGWALDGAVDAIVPMMYWRPTSPPGGRTDFQTLAEDFAPLKEEVRLLAGVSVTAGTLADLEAEIAIARKLGYTGVVVFSYEGLKKQGWLEKLAQGIFLAPARAPGPDPAEAAWLDIGKGIEAGMKALVTLCSSPPFPLGKGGGGVRFWDSPPRP